MNRTVILVVCTESYLILQFHSKHLFSSDVNFNIGRDKTGYLSLSVSIANIPNVIVYNRGALLPLYLKFKA